MKPRTIRLSTIVLQIVAVPLIATNLVLMCIASEPGLVLFNGFLACINTGMFFYAFSIRAKIRGLS